MTAPPLRQPGATRPPPAGAVWTAEPSRRSDTGRYHRRADCWAVRQPKLRRLWPSGAAAEAAGWWQCGWCAAPPACCAEGTHVVLALPRLAPAERPEWDDELTATEEG